MNNFVAKVINHMTAAKAAKAATATELASCYATVFLLPFLFTKCFWLTEV